MGIDVKRRVESMLSHKVKQQEVRQLRNEIAGDADGATQAELDQLKDAFEEHKHQFTPTAALEVKRVLNMGVVPGDNGKGRFDFDPFQGIDSSRRYASRWGVKDQFAAGYPTYQKSIEDLADLPVSVRKAGIKACARAVRQYGEQQLALGKPIYAEAIYDRTKRLIGYHLTCSTSSNYVSAQCYLKLDKKVSDGVRVIGAFTKYDPEGY